MLDDGNAKRKDPGAFGRLKDPRAILPSAASSAPPERVGDGEPAPVEVGAGLARRASKVLAIVLAVAAGLGTAWFAYEREEDLWLATFAFFVVGAAVAGIRDVVLVRPHAVKALQVLLLPLFCTWFLFGSYRALERWWAAVLVGGALGFAATLWVSKRVFGDVLEQPARGRTVAQVGLRHDLDLRMPRQCVRCTDPDVLTDMLVPVRGKVREQGRKVRLRFPAAFPVCGSCAQVQDEVARWTGKRTVALVVVLVLFVMGVVTYLVRWNDSSPFDILAMAGIFMLVMILLVPKIDPRAWELLHAVTFLGMRASPSGDVRIAFSFRERSFAQAFASLNGGRADPVS